MERYIGLDVHSQSCTVAVMGASGHRIGLQVVETSGAGLRQAIRAIPGAKRVCLEEGTQSAWVYEILEPEVSELVVTVPVRRQGPKDDAHDAWQLAEMLRTNAVERRVYKACGPYSQLRSAVRTYAILRQDVRRAKNRLRAIYRSRAIPTTSAIFTATASSRLLGDLPVAQRRSAVLLGEQIQSLEALWEKAECQLHAASKPHKIIGTLATAPAIGPIRAAQIVATVVTPHRFRTKRQFWAYCGLAVVTHSSADWTRAPDGRWVRARTTRTLGLNHNRNPALKEVFKGAAHQIATQMTSEPLHASYQRLLAGGVKPNLAMLTIARRLSAAVLAMWKHEEAYDATKHRVSDPARA